MARATERPRPGMGCPATQSVRLSRRPDARRRIFMARLSIGDRVSDLGGGHEGTLIEIDGETAYVMQTNGVEIEFALDRLKPYKEPEAKTARTLSGPLRDRTLSPAQKALLAS